MMERKIKYGTIAGVCALSMIGLNSCMKMDETYDLEKDIDMTITVGGNLTIPGSDTEKMLLKDLLDLEEDGVIVANATTGDYHLIQDGEKNTTAVNVPGVTVEMTNGFTGAGVSITVPPYSYGRPIESVSFDKNISIEVSQNNITSYIRELYYANTNCKETYLVFSKIGDLADVRLDKDFTIEFPDYITVKSEDADWVANENVLTLINENGLEVTESTRIKFQITKIDFEADGADFTPGSFRTNALTGETIDVEDGILSLGGEIALNGTISGEATSYQGGTLTLNANVESESMSIESVNAIVNPKVDITINPIELNDLPDVLTDNEVLLDLTDPRIYITLSNPSPLSVNLSADLIAMKTDKEDKKVHISNINIPAENENYKICINQIKDGEEGGINYVKVEKLSTIIEEIPEKIEMTNINTSVVQVPVEIELGKDFTIETDYNIDTPLMFGPRTYINYSETIDGWDADLEDMEFEGIEVSMTVVNEIPLGINLKAEAIDKDGNKLNNVEVDMDVNVQAGALGNAARQDVTFNITTTDGTINGLDGIKLNIEANAKGQTGEAALNENQSIQIIGLKLKLQDGITMDLN